MLVGLFNGVVVGVVGVQPIVATLSLLVGGRGLALVLTSGGLVQLFVPGLDKLASAASVAFRTSSSSALALVAVVAVLVRRTVFGYRVVAIGGNRQSERLAGLPVRRTVITVYALSGVLAAIAGIIATARLHSADPSYLGIGFELTAITAVVVGGSALSGGKVKVLRHAHRRRPHAIASVHIELAQRAGLRDIDRPGGGHRCGCVHPAEQQEQRMTDGSGDRANYSTTDLPVATAGARGNRGARRHG